MGETVPDESEFSTLDVLLDRVERLLFADFHLCVRPTGDLDHHVEDAIVSVCKEGNVVEGRDDLAVLLDKGSVLCDRLAAATGGREEQGVPKSARRLVQMKRETRTYPEYVRARQDEAYRLIECNRGHIMSTLQT